jgi:hypothetical protein
MRFPVAVAMLLTASSAAAEPPLFDFRVNFWINLHQRLFAESSMRAPPDRLQATSPAEQRVWDATLDWYRRRWPERTLHTLLSDDALIRTQRQLAVAGDAPSGVDAELAAQLAAAAPIYRAARWPTDEKIDRAWIAELQPRLQKYGDKLAQALPRLYGAAWPQRPIPVEVSRFAGPVGAYTLVAPTLITISGGDPRDRGDSGLEILFHEASHALVAPLQATLTRVCPTAKPTLWHAVLFYLTGAAVRRAIGDAYQPYAERNALYQRGDWNGLGPSLAQHLGPYVDGAQPLDRALAGLCASGSASAGR